MSSATAPAQPRTWRAGVVWGLALGISIWVLYFAQASTVDLLFWDVMVVPAVLGVAVIAVVLAALNRSLRSFCWGVAGGVLVTLPLALAAFAFLFAALDLE